MGFETFNQFISQHKIDGNSVNKPSAQLFGEIILSTAALEFHFLKELPDINIHQLGEFVHENSPYYDRIKRYLKGLKKQGLQLSNRPSNSEIYNVDMKSEGENLAVLSSQEFWNLNFVNRKEEP